MLPEAEVRGRYGGQDRNLFGNYVLTHALKRVCENPLFEGYGL
jgi:hypothetical protein